MDGQILDCRQLTQSFRMPDGSRLAAVNQASFTLKGGQTLAVRGASGSGKTTLLMMAAGMMRPQSGQVLLCGQDIYSLNSSRRSGLRRSQMGVILPTFHLLPYLSALKNVALAVPGGDGLKRAEELLEQVGLGDRRNQLPDRMSAGECRRLMVARALVHQPGWILADEPTANLDDSSANVIRKLLRDAVLGGAGLLVVTHDDPLLFSADVLHQMDSGNLR